jgi:hypothetical protein
MSLRARPNESTIMPPGNHPGLIRYRDDKSSTFTSKEEVGIKGNDESDIYSSSAKTYKSKVSKSSSMVEACGC